MIRHLWLGLALKFKGLTLKIGGSCVCKTPYEQEEEQNIKDLDIIIPDIIIEEPE